MLQFRTSLIYKLLFKKKPYYQHSKKIKNTKGLYKTTSILFVRLAVNEQLLKFSYTNRCVTGNHGNIILFFEHAFHNSL